MLLKSGELLRQPCNLGKLQKVRKTSFYMVPILASSIHGPFLQITEAFPLKAVSEAVGDVLILFLGRTVIPEIAMDLSYLHAKFAKGSRGAFWGLQYTGFFFFFFSPNKASTSCLFLAVRDWALWAQGSSPGASPLASPQTCYQQIKGSWLLQQHRFFTLPKDVGQIGKTTVCRSRLV